MDFPSKIRKEFTEFIETLLARDLDGPRFFETVDFICQDKLWAHWLVEVARTRASNVLVTGKFGNWLLEEKLLEDFETVALAPGGLRIQGDTPNNFLIGIPKRPAFPSLPKAYSPFVFIDDTFYSGTTRSKCTAALQLQHKGLVTDSVVMYDGAKMLMTESLYRYWEHHPDRLEEIK